MKRAIRMAMVLAALWPGPSSADEPASNALLRQGADLFKRQDYEGARVAFARAYELDPRAATLLNLALSELNTDHPVEAAAHLREYLTHTDEPAAKLESVRSKWLPRAESRTARLDVFAPTGAQLVVDGVIQDQHPASGGPASLVVAAGEHDVAARQASAVETQHVVARGGELVELHFQRVPDAAVPREATGWNGPASEPRPEQTEGTSSRAKWITVVALGSGAVVATAVGVVFGLAANGKASDAQKDQGALKPLGAAWTGTECSASGAARTPCAQLRADVDANRQDWTLSTTAYIGAGVLAAASFATWMLWRPQAAKVQTAFVRPSVGWGNVGVAVEGAW